MAASVLRRKAIYLGLDHDAADPTPYVRLPEARTVVLGSRVLIRATRARPPICGSGQPRHGPRKPGYGRGRSFLASDEASYVSGTVVGVTGGKPVL